MKYLLTTCAMCMASLLMAQKNVVFREDFDNNNNSWSTSFNQGSGAIGDGVYTLDKTSGDGNWYFYKAQAYEADKDYTVEASIRQVSGVEDYGYGMCWGAFDNAYSFAISSNGMFTIYCYVNKEYTSIQAWTKSSAIKPLGQYNKLTVALKGDKLVYSINDEQVHEGAPVALWGFDFGVFVARTMKIQTDYIEFRQDKEGIRLIDNYPKELVKEDLGSNINTEVAEIAPNISADGKTLYFARSLSETNSDIFFAERQAEGSWGKALDIGKPLNNISYNFVIGVTPDGNTLYVGNTYNADGSQRGPGLSVSHRTESGWSLPQDVVITNFKNKAKYVYYNFAPDGKTLILCLQMDDRRTDQDLYVSFLQPDNTWSEPKNLGKALNTAADEPCAFVAGDGVTMYFSSNGKTGYGGYDVFITRRLDDTWMNWSEPLNLGPAVNSENGELYYVVPATGEYAYMSIYKDATMRDNLVRIKVPESAKPKPVVMISGRVLDSKTGKPLAADVKYESLTTGKELGIARTNPVDGAYKIALVSGQEYGFLAQANGYYPESQSINTGDVTAYKEITRDLYLGPIEVGQAIRLNNVFFDFAKFTLRPQSHAELNRLIDFLKGHPTMTIELGGHTDNVGDEATNMKLSQNRVNAVKEYLVTNGIDATRLVAKGYGKSKPRADNKTEEGRQTNRRVEFIFLKQ
jgi:outer membrane protein OmpA-like peptidoglycan-associated protein